MSYRVYAVRIFSKDWARTFGFYKDVIGLPVHFADPGMGWAQFQAGGADIGLERLAADDPEAAELVGRFVGISLEVDDIEATCAELSQKGVPFVGAPEKQPWGGTLAHFKDPDGNVVTLLGRQTDHPVDTQ